MRLLPLILSLLLFASCKKNDVNMDDMLGTYQWFASVHSNNDSYGTENSVDNYGFKITRKGNRIRIHYFKNDEKLFSSRIHSVITSGNSFSFSYDCKYDAIKVRTYKFSVSNGELVNGYYPHWGYSNKFFKQK